MDALPTTDRFDPSTPISLFVAMPYTDLGPLAKWPKIPEVEKFYAQVARAIKRKTGCAVNLRIEKYYIAKSGPVIEAMFRAIMDSDVFIADLTGWNANVFFELGVRCSLSRKTTILTTQEERPLPFDISPMNCVRYANGLEAPQKAAEAIAQIVHDERGTNAVRSLVRAFTEVEVVPQERWKILSGERIKTLLAAAKDAADPKQKLAHINEAVDIDPLSEAARIAQAGTLRAARQFDQALSATEIALKIFRNSARLYKEKGLILDKMSMDQIDKLDEAAQALQQALRFDSTDHDLHCCYGGVLRRRGLRPGNPERDRDLTASLLHYREGLKLDRHSSYAGLNELRLRLLMPNASNGQAGDMTAALKRMYYLCEFEVTHSQIANDAHRWWRMFDLADVHAFDEKQDEALSTYESAIKLIPELDRVDVLVSPFRVWKELLEADLLRKSIRTNAELILDLLKRNIA